MASYHHMVVVMAVALMANHHLPIGAAIERCAPAFVVHRGGGVGCRGRVAAEGAWRTLHQISPIGLKRRTSLTSTTARNDNAPNAPSRNYDVLYQKVLRAPAPANGQAPAANTLLIDVVSYLQYVFQLPGDLPMPYDLTVPDDDANNEQSREERAVLIIDSPLGNDQEARLEVEVLGIFPDNADVNAGPKLAMVALKKHRDGASGSGVSGELFAASEKRIAQWLDRGLQDLEEGRISIPQSVLAGDDSSGLNDMKQFEDDDDGVDAAVKRIGYENAVNAASASGAERKEPLSIERDGLGNVVIDSPSRPVEDAKAKRKTKTVQSPDPAQKKRTSDKVASANQMPQKRAKKPSAMDESRRRPREDDYAIQMARRQAESMMATAKLGSTTSSSEGTVAISGGESDFAILAAKRVAEAAREKGGSQKNANGDSSVKERIAKGSEARVNGSVAKASNAAPNAKKAKVQDLSNDEMFLKLNGIAREAKRSSWKRTIPKKKRKALLRSPDNAVDKSPQPKQSEKPVRSAVDRAADEGKNAAAPEKSDDEIQDDILRIAQQNEQVQRELKAATDMMPVEQEGEGLSPEELLAGILKFGEEKEKEEKPGQGFVEGAFEKARDLLQKEEAVVGSNSDKSMGFQQGMSVEEGKRRAEEEELRRIFAAGQSVAENRLSKPTDGQQSSSNLARPSITDEDIDALIDADETVPLNARVLDDELAELEVRMSRSQEEGSDGPPQNELFDVFSGPEVYNPNVDPETAVNWPGAKTDTRTDIRLARDLSTALKQAQFASAVLSQMSEEGGDGNGDDVRYYVGAKELSLERVTLLRNCVNEAVKAGIIEDPEILMVERSRMQMLLDELSSQPEERFEEIALNYKDLLLSDNLVDLIKERLHSMAQRDVEARREGNEDMHKASHARERTIMMNLAQLAQALVKEAQVLGAELEVSMLEVIRSICEVAMDPSHKSEEDTAIALADAVRDMRPLLDDAFVAYLKYAIAEEESKLARAGLVDDPEHNRWLFVLKIVQEGVYAELSQGVRRYIDHIWYVLRMKSKSERKALLKKLIDAMPTMDCRPFVKVVNNIVSSLGQTVKGDFSDGVILGDMTNELLQLQKDVSDLLPPERIDELSKDADAWAATQRQRLLERRNMTRQRLEAARRTGDIDPDEVIKKPGAEAERFD